MGRGVSRILSRPMPRGRMESKGRIGDAKMKKKRLVGDEKLV